MIRWIVILAFIMLLTGFTDDVGAALLSSTFLFIFLLWPVAFVLDCIGTLIKKLFEK